MKVSALLILFIFLSACSDSSNVKGDVASRIAKEDIDQTLIDLLKKAKRIPSSSGWFEIIKLPNYVYAIWEPGHVEKVNAYLIIGETRDVLYDTGMGIASIREAVNDVRRAEFLPDKELMVVNSHNHLDHNGGNNEFSEAWIYDNEWGIKKLTQGVPGGVDASFSTYWDQLTPHPGVKKPANFDIKEKSTAPFPRENIHLLSDGDVIDLGNRQFQVVHTTSHSPDGLA
ncbi:MAG: glyoxylase-like metal-dependent hydrolase (beta-lactamase superfamily II), partial [Candidatus Azotimanducaceae bacterium]